MCRTRLHCLRQEGYFFKVPQLPPMGDRYNRQNPRSLPSTSILPISGPSEHSNCDFQAMGVLRVLCEVTKLGSAEQVQRHKEGFLQFAQVLEGNQSLTGNTLIRQLRTKLVSRVAIRLLPAKIRRLRAKGTSSAP